MKASDRRGRACRFCRAELGLDADADENRRLEALFVLSITLGLRPGELRTLTATYAPLEGGAPPATSGQGR